MLTRSTSPRCELLLTVFTPDRMPPAPGIALQVYSEAESPDCDPARLAALLAADPALCAGLLRAANSCVYGLSRPVSSPARAVQVLGRRAVRTIALALSAPGPRDNDAVARRYWLASVGGAVIARELAVRSGRGDPDEDMAAALLRDVGSEVFRRAFPARWSEHQARNDAHTLADPCRVEEEAFGADHATVGGELLARWGLPQGLTEPVRYHHRPGLAPAGVLRSRSDLLWLSDALIHLDALADHPDLLAPVLGAAERTHSLDVPSLVQFLTAVVPKVDAFAAALNVNASHCPNLAATVRTASGTC